MKFFIAERVVDIPTTSDTVTIVSAERFLCRDFCGVNATIPLYIHSITDVSAVYTKLASFYSDTQKIVVGGVTCALKDSATCGDIYIEGAPFIERSRYTYCDLLEVIRRLRDPDGCPWDRDQTHHSIRENAIEESYELAEAVDLNSVPKMREESGDVFLQGLFHAVIAEDNGEFSELDMISELCHKLVSRHTHIFGENKAENSQDALMFWEQAKAVEKGQSSVKAKVDSVPVTFSALMKANKIQKIIKKTGFDFECVQDAYDKLQEEINELQEAKGDCIEGEAGDVLFAVVNIIRMLKLDPEICLNRTTTKFIRRFNFIEESAIKAGKDIYKCSLEEMEAWYQQYKREYENR
ncbi:MAG: nucleoside triphosphate pyrophosphohydrolase [Bacillota bacterium]